MNNGEQKVNNEGKTLIRLRILVQSFITTLDVIIGRLVGQKSNVKLTLCIVTWVWKAPLTMDSTDKVFFERVQNFQNWNVRFWLNSSAFYSYLHSVKKDQHILQQCFRKKYKTHNDAYLCTSTLEGPVSFNAGYRGGVKF